MAENITNPNTPVLFNRIICSINLKSIIDPTKKIILVTGHRRENHGQGFIAICEALKAIAQTNTEAQIIYPVHLNPKVQRPVYELLGELKNIHLIANK